MESVCSDFKLSTCEFNGERETIEINWSETVWLDLSELGLLLKDVKPQETASSVCRVTGAVKELIDLIKKEQVNKMEQE